MERLNIYFMHSDKFDYTNLLYKPILQSSVCLSQNLILPYSKDNVYKYAKDLIEKADLIIVDVYEPSYGLILELKWLSKNQKKVLYLSYDNKIDSKVSKYVKNIVIHDSEHPYIKIIEDFINSELSTRDVSSKDEFIIGEF